MRAYQFFYVVYCSFWIERILAAGSKCSFTSPSPIEEKLLNRLSPIIGKRLKVESIFNNATKYLYNFGICTEAIDGEKYKNVGMLQTEVKDKNPQIHILGLYNETHIRGGHDWLFLIYKGGDFYHHHCNDSGKLKNRESHVMFTCDEDTELSDLLLIDENNDEYDECYYLFEVSTKYMCTPQKPVPSGSTDETLGTGSIFCIIFFTTAGVYMIIGFLYQRIVVGAKGLEQIPNFSFWKEFGKLQADGCDFLCRCGERQEMKMYRGIDDQLLNVERREEPDDRLLPM